MCLATERLQPSQRASLITSNVPNLYAPLTLSLDNSSFDSDEYTDCDVLSRRPRTTCEVPLLLDFCKSFGKLAGLRVGSTSVQ